MEIVLIVLLAIVVLSVIGGICVVIFYLNPLSIKIYEEQVVRTSKEKFGSACTYTDNEEQVIMWNTGLEWAEPFKDKKEIIEIENMGLKLHAEYYDFGSDTCIISIPGRSEGLMYGYYFDIPYQRDMGMNVLAVDPRSHGESEGKFHSLGHYEHMDLDKWITLLEERYGIKKVFLHCICVGTCTGLLMAINGKKRENVKGIITEGAFVTFKETFREHIKYEGKPTFPVLQLCMHHIEKNTDAKIMAESPQELVKKLETPILFLHSREDRFSLPDKTAKMFETCTSKNKKIVWFDKGSHSHLRINNEAEYDRVIKEFVATCV